MAKSDINFINENGTGHNRQHNIAVVMLNLSEMKYKSINTKTLRALVRKALNLPVLTGEEYNGDMRAHSDACGGHGFQFDQKVSKINNRIDREILFNEGNISKCKKFLSNPDNGSLSEGDASKFLGLQ